MGGEFRFLLYESTEQVEGDTINRKLNQYHNRKHLRLDYNPRI